MDKTKTIAIVAVVIIVVAACAVVLGNGGGDKDKDTSFSIVDGNGTTFDFDGPIDGIVSVNTNVPKAMKILGYEDQLKESASTLPAPIRRTGKSSAPCSPTAST